MLKKRINLRKTFLNTERGSADYLSLITKYKSGVVKKYKPILFLIFLVAMLCYVSYVFASAQFVKSETYPTNDSWNSSTTINFQCNASVIGNASIANLSIYSNLSGAGWSVNLSNSSVVTNNTLYTLSLGSIPDGHYNWTCGVWERNSSGGGTASETVNTTWGARILKVDRTAPLINLSRPTNNNWSNTGGTRFEFNLSENNKDSCRLFTSSSDNGSTGWAANYTLNSVDLGNGNNITVTFVNGSFSWNMLCNDSAGINATASSNFTFGIDTTQPNISFSNVVNSSNFSGIQVWINGTAVDNTSGGVGIGVNYTWINDSRWNNTGTNVSFTFVNVSLVAEGNYTLNISSNDSFNQIFSVTLNISVDMTPPTTNPTLDQVNDTNNDGNIEVNWTVDSDEPAASYRIYRYTGAVISVNSTNIGSATLVYTTANNAVTFEDNTSIANNATTYSYVLVTVDAAGNANTSVVSNTKNFTANDTINPKQSTNLSGTGSAATATLTWLNVTQDISGNAESSNYWYNVYRGTSINFSARNVTDPTSGLSLLKNVSTNYTTDSVTTSGTYHYVITTVDDGGNENKTVIPVGTDDNYFNVSLTYTAADDDGGSSSGGAGTTDDDEVTATYAHVWSDMAKGSNTMTINKDEIALTKVTFTITSAASNVEITVKTLSSRPTSTKVGKTVYQYIEVEKTNLDEDDIEKATIKFKVEKKWLTDEDAKIGQVVLMRYSNNKWNALTTTPTTSDELYYYFTASSPGLSYFAIAISTEGGGSDTDDDTDDSQDLNETDDGDAEDEEKSEGISIGGLPTWASVLIVVTGVAALFAVILFVYKKKSFALSRMLKFKREKKEPEQKPLTKEDFPSDKDQPSDTDQPKPPESFG